MKLAITSGVALALMTVTLAESAESLSPSAADTEVSIARMSPGHTYFNKPGATPDEHRAEVESCMKLAHAARAVDELIGNDRGLIPALLSEGPKRGVYAAAIENCMVVRGWRVVRPSAEMGEGLSTLPPSELATQLAQWVGAETPPHEIVRAWNNDAAHSATVRYETRPPFVAQGSLSVVAVSGSAEPTSSPRPTSTAPRIKLDKKWQKKPLTPAQIANIPAGSAVIIAHIKGVSMRNGVALTLSRDWTESETPASAVDFAPDTISLAQGLLGAKPEGRLIAVAVPPGRWSISGMGIIPAINFCMGAPSFEVAAGEVVFAGSFDMSSAKLTPDLSLTLAQAFLAGQPAAGRLRAAQYTNGTVAHCGGSILYALEFDGAPFVPGYAWGSRVGISSASPAASPIPERDTTLLPQTDISGKSD